MSTSHLKALIDEVVSYERMKSQCPVSVIQEILSYFPRNYNISLKDAQYNGLVHVGGQGILIKCISAKAENAMSYAQWGGVQKNVALKIARIAYNHNIIHGQSGLVKDYKAMPSIPDQRF